MTRDYVKWRSHQLQREMELVVFGDAGVPMIVFPTSMGSFFEFEDRGMVDALSDKIHAGALQLFCVSTIDRDSFYGDHLPPRQRIDGYLAWERYLLEDIVPFVRHRNGSQTMGVTGCSFGAFHAFLAALRHPDIFTSTVTMGGAFDLKRFLDGYTDTDAYLLSPVDFLPQLRDAWFLDRIRANKWVLVTGEHDICRQQTEAAAAMLAAHGVPHSLHVWGHGSLHDWPEWVKMARAYLP
jgi:esterase/lipase superfamily enzyme